VPVYLFRHPETSLVIEQLQKMTEPHVYVDDDGVEWERVWTSPNASLDSIVDSDSAKQFAAKTKGWSTGDMWDYSSELSQSRKDKRGLDHIGEAHNASREKKIADKRKNLRKSQGKKKP
tara:strand:+ start:1043 stop:1399 length:357 start_codon:yes stop_codon:yes gene_type:complete